MNFRVPPSAATAAAALAAGAFLGQMMELGAGLFGPGPLPATAALASGALGLFHARSGDRTRGLLPLLAGVGVWRAEDLIAIGARAGSASTIAGIGIVVIYGLSRAVGSVFADALGRATRSHALLLAGGLAGGWLLGRVPVLLFVLVNALMMGCVSSPLRRLRPPLVVRGAWRSIAATLVCGVGWTAAVILQPALSPEAGAWLFAGAGMLAGVGVAAHPALALVGAAMSGTTAFVALDVRAAWLDWGPLGGDLVLGTFGLGIGMIVGALRPTQALGWTPLASIGVGLLVLPVLPARLVQRTSPATATVPTVDLPTLAKARTSMPTLWAGARPGGVAVVRGAGSTVQVELDGVLRTTEDHAGAAELVAGLLAGCTTEGRRRALVTGDEFGLVSSALQGQGFLLVDNAAPVPAVRRAVAQALPLARRTWLHPSTRLLPIPARSLPLVGAGADTLVEVMTQPWAGLPDADHLGLVRRQLAAGGSYVLALGATRLPEVTLRGVLHDVASVWPSASLWLPPEGVDTLLIVGADDPIPWSRIGRCRAADAERAARLRIATDLDLAALAHADGDALRALPPAPRTVGVPIEARGAPRLPAGLLTMLDTHADRIFADDAPRAEILDRARSRAAWLTLVATAGGTAPGTTPSSTSRALDPLVAPLLKQARTALERARAEGLLSKAWQEADGAARAAVALSPTSAAAHCLQATVDAERGQWSPATASFQTCATLDPASIAAWDGLASVRQAQNDLVGAEDALRKALAVAPQRWQANHNLGLLLVRLGRLEEAEELLKKGAALAAQAGDDASPHLALASLYLRTDRPALALVEAEKAMGIEASADTWYFHGAASWDLQHPEAAEHDFREALTANPRHVLARGGLGLVQARRGDFEAAALSFQAVLAADPQNQDAKKNLAAILPRVNPELLKGRPAAAP